MRMIVLLSALLLVAAWQTGCSKKNEQTPCQKLIAHEIKCNYQNRSTLDDRAKKALVSNCEGKANQVGMRSAIDCSKGARDCTQFLSCRKQSTELPGGS
jgi:hypothetical protein